MGSVVDELFYSAMDVADSSEASMPSPAGSSSLPVLQRLPGKIGQASPQPMVMTTSESPSGSVVRTCLLVGDAMRTWAMAGVLTGSIRSAGMDPETALGPAGQDGEESAGHIKAAG